MKNSLKPYADKARAWWGQREQREQRLLSGLAALLIVAFVWWVIWQPLNASIEQSQRQVAAQQETLRWVLENTERVRQLRGQEQPRSSAISSQQLTQFINQTASGLELEISRIQPQGEALLLVFNEADFDALLQLVATLAERQVQIDAMDIAETSTAGVVRVRRLQVRAAS